MWRIADNLERCYRVKFYFHVQFFINDIYICLEYCVKKEPGILNVRAGRTGGENS